MRFCPEKAIIEREKEVGVVEIGRAKGFSFLHGKLKIGQIMAPAVIRGVKSAAQTSEFRIIDAPPGTSCSVIEAVKDADYVILVTEPTPFGLNDLKLAVGMVRALKLNFAVAINRCDVGDEAVKQYCQTEGIKIILEIPNDRRIAQAYSQGEIASECLNEYTEIFNNLIERITGQVINVKSYG